MATVASSAALPQIIVYRPGTVAHHHGDYVHPIHRVVSGVWPAPSPETCRDFSPGGVWIGPADREVLVCCGCGLDCT